MTNSWKPTKLGDLHDWIIEQLTEHDFDDEINRIIHIDPEAFRETIESLIEDGRFDKAVENRFANSNKLIDEFCDPCEHRCGRDGCERRE